MSLRMVPVKVGGDSRVSNEPCATSLRQGSQVSTATLRVKTTHQTLSHWPSQWRYLLTQYLPNPPMREERAGSGMECWSRIFKGVDRVLIEYQPRVSIGGWSSINRGYWSVVSIDNQYTWSKCLKYFYMTLQQDWCWKCLAWVYNQTDHTNHKHMTRNFVTAKHNKLCCEDCQV